ncbi:Spo0B domain-containing protein [Paenibacillus allorhizosphaerae]|uniref:SpoOB alpha-helical domain-containing protein n=1 Tax=Paenibacillus allorhizosphaerae TaxID=2849866 RepID=A0ABN7TTM9_9BACL|nr:Spo0B domain-containing protein [Paenibacillus allorhizosphaerae]CAG7655300.1 hypothetical protein PAECIP111802_06071 [Paenibacillus allorhizosphaerae]
MTTNTNGRTTEKKSRNQNEQTRAGAGLSETSEADLRLLRLFNHYRHDWMNDIQMVMGYIQLKKVDKLSDLMEKIKEKVRVESCVSKLGIPSLIVYLLSFQAEVKELQLLIRLEEEIHLHKYRHAAAAEQWITSLLESFKREAVDSTEMQNTITLQFAKEQDGLCLAAKYEGAYEPKRIQAAEMELQSRLLDQNGIGLKTIYGDGRVTWTVHLA